MATTTTETTTNRRYCPMCDVWMKTRECKDCGMPTETVASVAKTLKGGR